MIRKLFKQYMKKCASENIPEHIALAEFLKRSGSVELGNKLLKTAVDYGNLGRTIVKYTPLAYVGYRGVRHFSGVDDDPEQKLVEMNRELARLKRNLTPSAVSHILTGGTIGSTLGTVYGPQMLDKLDPTIAKVIGGISGGALGAFAGKGLHNLTYN